MNTSAEKLKTIQTYLNDLLTQLPNEMNDGVRTLQAHVRSLRTNLELAQRHQAQASSDLKRVLETLTGLQNCTHHITDASQKLTLLAQLIESMKGENEE